MAPGEQAAVGVVGLALAVDVVLLQRGCDSISTCVRRSWIAKGLALYLAAHVCVNLPHDPLVWIGSRLSRA